MKVISYLFLLVGILCSSINCNSQKNEDYYRSKGYQVFSEYQFAVKCPATLKDASRQSNDDFDFNYAGYAGDSFYQIMIIKMPAGRLNFSKEEEKAFLKDMFSKKGGQDIDLEKGEYGRQQEANRYAQSGQNQLSIKDNNIYFDGQQITFDHSDKEAIYMKKYNVIIFTRIGDNEEKKPNSIWKYDLLKKTKKLIESYEDYEYVGDFIYDPNMNSDVFYYRTNDGTPESMTNKYDMGTNSSQRFLLSGSILKIIDSGKYKGCFIVGNSGFRPPPCFCGRVWFTSIYDKEGKYIGCIGVEGSYGVENIDSLDYNNITLVEPPHCEFDELNSAYKLAQKGLQYINEFQQNSENISLKDKIEQLKSECESNMSDYCVTDVSDFPDKLQAKAEIVYDFLEKSDIIDNIQTMRTYTKSGFGSFSINYPQDWEVIRNPNSVVCVMIRAPEAGNGISKANFNVIVSHDEASLETKFAASQEQYEKLVPEYSLLKKDYVSIDGMHCIKVSYKARMQGINIKGIIYQFKKPDDTVYTITFTVHSPSYDTYITVFDQIIKSFKTI